MRLSKININPKILRSLTKEDNRVTSNKCWVRQRGWWYRNLLPTYATLKHDDRNAHFFFPALAASPALVCTYHLQMLTYNRELENMKRFQKVLPKLETLDLQALPITKPKNQKHKKRIFLLPSLLHESS